MLPVFARAADPTDPAGNRDPVRLQEIEVTGTAVSAQTQAPTDAKLDATQPASTINENYISNNVAPSADYATIAKIAPSVANVETNGPGLSESKHLTIRGFDDSSYNVTFDGIPFSDYNTFSHHSTSYFPAKLLGQVEVDRGPGTASTIGYATFGGTIALSSKDPRTDAAFIPTVSYGSWNTQLYHFEFNSGLLPSLNDASVIGSYQYISTDGFRTHSDMTRDTYYIKYVQPVGKDTTLTVLSTYNDIKFNNPGTVTRAPAVKAGVPQALDINTYGYNAGLLQGATGAYQIFNTAYNYQEKQADFEYIGFDTRLGENLNLTDKIYTFAYNNDSHESPVISSGNHTKPYSFRNPASNANVLGQYKVNQYRSFGDTLQLAHEDNVGTFKTGAWLDFDRNTRYNYSIDYTNGGVLNPINVPGKFVNGYAYDLVDYITTVQPFAEYEWHATSQLTLDAGIKYDSFRRDIHARLNQTTITPLDYAKTYGQTLGSVLANYKFTREWSAYAQVAQGFLAPPESEYYVTHPGHNDIKPQETTNYQLGTVFKNDRFNGDIDVYYINYQNLPVTIIDPVDPSATVYEVAGGAIYDGIETEGTYYIGEGFSAYANGSINQGTYKNSKADIQGIPQGTAALGLIFDKSGVFGSIIDKYVAPEKIYGNTFDPNNASTAYDQAKTIGYSSVDAAIGYSLKVGHSYFRSIKIKLEATNLTGKKTEILDSIKRLNAGAYNPLTDNYYNVLPGRGYFLTVSADF